MFILINYLILSIFVVNIIVFFHSAGHYVVARLLGVRVETVSIGLGPRIFRFGRDETTWKICWIPVGGFVRTHAPTAENPAYARHVLATLSGPFSSALFALFVFLVLFAVEGAPKISGGELIAVPQSIPDSISTAMRTLLWTWQVWSPEQMEVLPATYDTPTVRIICLAAIWSSKFGLINLIPLPKFDGKNILRYSLASMTSMETSELATRWIVRALALFAFLFISYLIYTDVMNIVTDNN